MDLSIYAQEYHHSLSVIENCNQLLKRVNKEKTLDHVVKVSKTGLEIASNYDLDKNKIEIACYLHDISAIIPEKDYIKLCEANNIEVLDVERKLPMLLHQKLSRLIAEEIFNIEDEEILRAIEWHTTLKAKPFEIQMAVFVADKLSWDQDGVPPFFNCVSEGLKESLETACFEYISYCLNNDMIRLPHPMLMEAKNYLEEALKNEKVNDID